MFKGAVATVAEISSEEHRAEALAGLFLAAYLGLAGPVIGLGALTQLASMRVSLLAFAGVLAFGILAAAPALVGRRGGRRGKHHSSQPRPSSLWRGPTMYQTQLMRTQRPNTGLEITRCRTGCLPHPYSDQPTKAWHAMTAVNAHTKHPRLRGRPRLERESFLLQRVQPGLSGLMDGALSTLAPIFAVALATHRPLTAFYTGIATALGAASAWRSPKACLTPAGLRPRQPRAARRDHRRRDVPRRCLSHAAIPDRELSNRGRGRDRDRRRRPLLLGWLRHRFFGTSFLRSFVSVTVGGAIIAGLSAALGVLAAG